MHVTVLAEYFVGWDSDVCHTSQVFVYLILLITPANILFRNLYAYKL